MQHRFVIGRNMICNHWRWRHFLLHANANFMFTCSKQQYMSSEKHNKRPPNTWTWITKIQSVALRFLWRIQIETVTSFDDASLLKTDNCLSMTSRTTDLIDFFALFFAYSRCFNLNANLQNFSIKDFSGKFLIIFNHFYYKSMSIPCFVVIFSASFKFSRFQVLLDFPTACDIFFFQVIHSKSEIRIKM